MDKIYVNTKLHIIKMQLDKCNDHRIGICALYVQGNSLFMDFCVLNPTYMLQVVSKL